MGLYKRYNDAPLLTRLDNVESSITDIVVDNDSQAQSLVTLFQADIDQNAINRVYLRREKSSSTTVPLGNNPVDIQYDYQVQGNLKGIITTSDAITFTFTGNGVFLINTVVSFTDLVMPNDPLRGYIILDMIIPGQKKRRLAGDHPNGNIGNLSLQGSTVLIANAGTSFKIQGIIVDQGTIYGQVADARTYLEIFQL
jgi:hypothetical protein